MTKRVLLGEVVSLKNSKTVGVLVERRVMHPLYRKLIRTRKVYQVHDEKAKAKLQDRVEIVECRPISKTKHFRLGRVLASEDLSLKEAKLARRKEELRAKRQAWLKEYGAYYAFHFKRFLARAVEEGWSPEFSEEKPELKPRSESVSKKRVSRRSAAAKRKTLKAKPAQTKEAKTE